MQDTANTRLYAHEVICWRVFMNELFIVYFFPMLAVSSGHYDGAARCLRLIVYFLRKQIKCFCKTKNEAAMQGKIFVQCTMEEI